MVISDGAILPLSGIIDNTGTIELNSTGSATDLELIEHGITLQGHGQVILSDSGENVITGTVSDVKLTNVDNTISGAGHLGDGQMTLVNEGTIIATGTNALDIDTGTNVVVNTGTLGSDRQRWPCYPWRCRKFWTAVGEWRQRHHHGRSQRQRQRRHRWCSDASIRCRIIDADDFRAGCDRHPPAG